MPDAPPNRCDSMARLDNGRTGAWIRPVSAWAMTPRDDGTANDRGAGNPFGDPAFPLEDEPPAWSIARPTMTKIVPDDGARQGPSGRPVLGVLISPRRRMAALR